MRRCDQSKKWIALALTALMLVGGFSPAGALQYASAETDQSESSVSKLPGMFSGQSSEVLSGESSGNAPESLENQVIVLYKEDAVDTEAPATKAEKQSAKNAKTASSFGEIMEGNSKSEGTKAENTLDQQAEILEDSLQDDYEIQDTLVFDSVDSAAGNSSADSQDPLVVSVVASDNLSTEEMIQKLEDNDQVAAAEPNRRVSLSSVTSSNADSGTKSSSWNDAYMDSTWQLGSAGINASDGWDAYDSSETKSKEDVVVAVLDCGVDDTHEDLKDHMWTKPEGFPLSGGDHGINLVESGYLGSDANEDINDSMDKSGHGTHCAGIIAAQANNGLGISGVFGADKSADHAGIEIMAVRVMNSAGIGYDSWIISGFYYVLRSKELGVNLKAVNCSLGGEGESTIYNTIFDRLGEAGVVICVAAGNENKNIDQTQYSPAGSVSDNTVTVAAADEDGSLASYSSYGERNVDILAPGSNILSSVSYYNYIPWRYSAETLTATTKYYAEFDDNTKITNEGSKITVVPSKGTDAAGTSISTDTFEAGTLVSSKGAKEATVSVKSDEDSRIAAASQDSSLQIEIKNASEGDEYALYFPYAKDANSSKSYSNVLNKVTCSGSNTQVGLAVGDIGVKLDGEGNLEDTDIYQDELSRTSMYNSLWSEDGSKANVQPVKKQKSGYEYGLGIMIEIIDDGDVTVNLGSLGVSKPVTGSKSSTTLENNHSFGKYALYSGSSMATPVAAGAVALIAAMNPDATAKELVTLLKGTGRETANADGIVSTGKELDFAEYSDTKANNNPSISGYTVNDAKDTVTLEGSGFGSSEDGTEAVLTAACQSWDAPKEIKAEDITRTSSSITIKNASSYQLSGNEITFTLKMTKAGKTSKTKATYYLLNGKKSYTKEYSFEYDSVWEEDDEEEEYSVPSKVVSAQATEEDEEEDEEEDDDEDLYDVDLAFVDWISNDAAMWGHSLENGEIYILDEIGLIHYGQSLQRAIETYATKMAKSSDSRIALRWKLESGEEYTVKARSNAVYYNGTIYQLVDCCRGRDSMNHLLVGIDMTSASPTWKVYSDNTLDDANAPKALDTTKDGWLVLGHIDGKLYAIGDGTGDGKGNVQTSSTVESFRLTSGATWQKEESIPADIGGLNGGTTVQLGSKLYYVLGTNNDNPNYSVVAFDGKTWELAGTLPTAKNTYQSKLTNNKSAVSASVGVDSKGIIFGGASTNGYGDTYRFNVSTGKVESLNYALWNEPQISTVSGFSVGGKFYALKSSPTNEEGTQMDVLSMPIESAYKKITVKKSGKGTGTVTAPSSVLAGRKATVTITPKSGSYIYSYSVTSGTSKKYGKPTTTSKTAKSLSLTVSKDTTVSVHFGKTVTKVKLNKTSLKLKRNKSYKLKATVTGTNTSVKWKVSNKKYASVSSSGKVKIKKHAKKGKTVKVTAYSKENSKIKATCKIKIK